MQTFEDADCFESRSHFYGCIDTLIRANFVLYWNKIAIGMYTRMSHLCQQGSYCQHTGRVVILYVDVESAEGPSIVGASEVLFDL